MLHVTDMMGRSISLSDFPKRIISLVPSQTELLVDLGLRDRLVGVTKFCVHPAGLKKSCTLVGGTKQYRMEQIQALAPDLIIGNKEENEREGIQALAEKYPVWMSDIVTLEDSFRMMQGIGAVTGAEERAEALVTQLRAQRLQWPRFSGRVAYFIWRNPHMVAGRGTFIHEMLTELGFENVIQQERYPEVQLPELKALAPEYIFLSSEPFPFKEKHVEEFRFLAPGAKVIIVDGELFSWYGSRLLHARDYFTGIFSESLQASVK
ncbi:periplasmic-binding protein [Nitritalea halalkaliphila LW7]|uniref:Periplasmic-binding protein n=1 Tax=Nitritalea halalkaliphila LW7 TaxID=1189621 RepID=I5CA32_9BACT|nr:helical backbone metal receptor [Nitritalea halalkaliphila]EIM78684.1 periplasmic-binding protein [Nitritalea halalkaliphila LW7]